MNWPTNSYFRYNTPEKLELYNWWKAKINGWFSAAGIAVKEIGEFPNAYCGDDCCPSLFKAIVDTEELGEISVWHRKRVYVINWNEHPVVIDSARRLFPGWPHTISGFELHCWKDEEMVKVLTKLKNTVKENK